LADLVTSDDDPFEGAGYSGVGVSLDGTVAELSGTLAQLLDREGNLFRLGLVCDLKDAGQDCRTCPAATVDPSQSRSALCRIGKDQCMVAQRIEDMQGPLLEIGDAMGEFVEIGDLSGEYAELLEAVGL
jgi:hypothetical protein